MKREGVRLWRSEIPLLPGGLLSKNAYKVLTKKYFGNVVMGISKVFGPTSKRNEAPYGHYIMEPISPRPAMNRRRFAVRGRRRLRWVLARMHEFRQ